MTESVLNQEEQKLNTINQSTQDQNKTAGRKRIAGIVLSVLMIGLSAFIMKLQHDNNQILSQTNDLSVSSAAAQSSNYRSYVQQYKETKIQLDETTRKLEEVTKQLDDVTNQLNTTKTMLTQTQTMLMQAQAENNKLKEDIQSLDGIKVQENVQNISDLEARIAVLKNKNKETNTELNDLKAQLKTFQADFSTMEEGRALIGIFQNKIRLVKSRMHHLAQEAYFAKIEAQKEKDRIAALNGNSGFLVKEGKAYKPSTPKPFSVDVKLTQ